MDSATAALVWAACRPVPDLDAVRVAIEGGADLTLVAHAAMEQRVSPLLWRALGEVAPDRCEEEWATTLRHDATRCRAHALMVLPQLGPLALAPLAEAGVAPLAFKGAALAERYPEPGLRPMDDADLILPPEQLDAGVAVLKDAGWRTVDVRARTHHEVVLTHPALPGLPVELHRALATWRERSNHLTTADLWRWRVESCIGDQPVFGLPREEEIVALAAHAAKPFHVFTRLIWTVDIAVVIADAERTQATIDWDRVARLADGARCRTGLAVALAQAHRLGAASPPEVRRGLAGDARARAIQPVLSAEWPLLERTWGMRARLRYALVDDWRQRVTLLLGQIIEAGPRDAPRNAVNIGTSGARRWWHLRKEAATPEADITPAADSSPRPPTTAA